jgi:hypothetical protein
VTQLSPVMLMGKVHLAGSSLSLVTGVHKRR